MAQHHNQRRLNHYKRINGDDSYTLLPPDKNSQYSNPNLRKTNLWKVSTLFFQLSTIICMVLLFRKYREESYESGYPTEFSSAFSNSDPLYLQTIRFNSPIIFNNNGTNNTYRTKYIADPNPEIDAAWDELVEDRYFWVTEEEAKLAFPALYKQYYHDCIDEGFAGTTGYMVEFDVLHTLHCVNRLRKALSPEYYFPHTDLYNFNAHNYHCIDHLRQVVMCYSVLTPIPKNRYDDVGTGAIDPNQIHMCRDFNAIRRWVNGRNSTIPGH